MLMRITCHWTIVLATVILLLSLDVCICSTTRDLQTNSNEYNENTKLTNTVDPIVDSELTNIRDKRKWSKFASWGKRNWTNNKWTNNKQLWGENRWMNFPKWGQRDILKEDDTNVAQFTPEKRKWSPFVSWGKRDIEAHEGDEASTEDSGKLADDLRVNKRGWSKLPAWGKRDMEEEPVKRRWSQLSAWGKRDESLNDVAYIDSDEKDTPDSSGNLDDKRNWSKFSSWGKRGNVNSDDLSSLEEDKRAWSKFPTWGKRNEDGNLEKRKWSQLAAWGKRDLDGNAMDKKVWSKFASWGKRYLELNPLNKRRWSPLAAWGKRSEDNNTSSDPVNDGRTLLNFFDINGDGAIDDHELQTYTETLMETLSTKQKSGDDEISQNKQEHLSSVGEVII